MIRDALLSLKGGKMRTQIEALRQEMKKNNIDCYMVVTDDYHSSEYVGDYFKEREYLSGFTGSAGKIIVTMDEATLWTDGRYFIQAEKELCDSGIELYKMGEKNVKSIEQYLSDKLSENATLGFDGRTINAKVFESVQKKLEGKNIHYRSEIDLVGNIWKDRPKLRITKTWELEEKYSGESRSEKIKRLKEKIREKNCDMLITTALDEIAWLLNIRGSDVDYNLVVLGYCIINASDDKKDILYLNEKSLDEDMKERLQKEFVIKKYNQIYEDVKDIDKNKKVYIDKSKTNMLICNNISCEVKNGVSIIMQMKAVKNKIEIENEKQAHIKDSVAVTKLIYYIKTNYRNKKITELDIVNKLEAIRNEIDGYIEPSFGTISAYGSNGAIVHYEPNEESNARIEGDSYLLVDAGGHYIEGTTDMTRTISCGSVSDEQKLHYTAVLKGNIRLSAAKFLYGLRGTNLDYIAREPLWKLGLDYKHGTGHGVGYLLNVHEGPNSFRWRIIPNEIDNVDAVLEEGMITSNEPGIYIRDKYGIRIENLIACKQLESNEYGQFMGFEILTYIPYDRGSIDVKMLNREDIELLNNYNATIREKISRFLDDDEREWLENETRELVYE